MNKRNVILCIDDEVIVLDSLKEQLQTEYKNYMIEVAESGEEAMEIINELEPTKRGIYAGCVGYFSFYHNLDTAITIRTLVFEKDRVYVQAGAGIVADSIPENEYY